MKTVKTMMKVTIHTGLILIMLIGLSLTAWADHGGIDPDKKFAWGENVGWLKFRGSTPDYGVRTPAFDTQPLGTPNWWLAHHDVAEGHDAGDGIPAWRKYVMDTDPNIKGDYLRILAVSNTASATAVVFSPASARRYYTLSQTDDPQTGDWSNAPGQVPVPGADGEQTLQTTNTAARMFYSVNVTVTP